MRDLGHLGDHPVLGEGPLGDLVFDAFDGDGIGVDAEDAGPLAGRGAQPAGELGEVVGGVEAFGRLGPVAPPHQVVPLGDEVAERTAFVAEGDAAVHAPGPLLAGRLLGERLVDLAPVPDADGDGTAPGQATGELDETGGLAHQSPISRGPRP